MAFCGYFEFSKVVGCRCFVLSDWTFMLTFWHFVGRWLFWVLFQKLGYFVQLLWERVGSKPERIFDTNLMDCRIDKVQMFNDDSVTRWLETCPIFGKTAQNSCQAKKAKLYTSNHICNIQTLTTNHVMKYSFRWKYKKIT